MNRFFRVMLYIGGASCAAFWLISVWLDGAAAVQPSVATGLFQHPYAFKGRIGFLTNGQALLASIGNVLAYGWGLAAISGAWLLYDERKVNQVRSDMLSLQNRTSHEPAAKNSTSTMFLRGVRDAFPAVVQLESPLSPSDCLSRLRSGLQMEHGRISGYIAGTRLKARKIISYRNSFQTVISARIYDKTGRTFIRCRSSMPLFASMFFVFWFGAFGLVFINSIESLIGPSPVRWDYPSAPWNAAFFCAMLLAFGAGLLIFCRTLANGEQEFLIDFIRDRTNASVVSDGFK